MVKTNADIINTGNRKLFMASVDKLVPDGQMMIMGNVFIMKMFISAWIKRLAIVKYKIILEGRMC